MRAVHLACVGPSHRVYVVKAVKETIAGAQEVLAKYRVLREIQALADRSPMADCGFTLSWLVVGDESESMGDPDFAWDDRQARAAAAPPKPKRVC